MVAFQKTVPVVGHPQPGAQKQKTHHGRKRGPVQPGLYQHRGQGQARDQQDQDTQISGMIHFLYSQTQPRKMAARIFVHNETAGYLNDCLPKYGPGGNRALLLAGISY